MKKLKKLIWIVVPFFAVVWGINDLMTYHPHHGFNYWLIIVGIVAWGWIGVNQMIYEAIKDHENRNK